VISFRVKKLTRIWRTVRISVMQTGVAVLHRHKDRFGVESVLVVMPLKRIHF